MCILTVLYQNSSRKWCKEHLVEEHRLYEVIFDQKDLRKR